MKINIGYVVLMAALSPTANAWSLYANGKTIQQDSELDISCDKLPLKKGQKITFKEAVWERCEFEVFEDTRCNDWAGKAKDDWNNHKLSKNVRSYKVNCIV